MQQRMEAHLFKFDESSIVITSTLAFGTTTYTFPSSAFKSAVKNGETEPRFILLFLPLLVEKLKSQLLLLLNRWNRRKWRGKCWCFERLNSRRLRWDKFVLIISPSHHPKNINLKDFSNKLKKLSSHHPLSSQLWKIAKLSLVLFWISSTLKLYGTEKTSLQSIWFYHFQQLIWTK